MQRKKFECESCDAYGTINHDMDSEFYRVEVCPFCSSELNDKDDAEDDE